MSNLNELSSSVQNLAKQYKGVIEVGEFLASLGSLDNLACEIEARVEKAKQAETAKTEQLHKIEAAVAEQAATHDSNIKIARERAEKIVAEATDSAERVLSDARERATEIDAGARARLEAHDGEFQRLTDSIDALNAEIGQARGVLAETFGRRVSFTWQDHPAATFTLNPGEDPLEAAEHLLTAIADI